MDSDKRRHFRTCHLCEAMCGVEITHQNGQILSIKGDKDDVLSQGHICPKAVALQDLQNDPDRLRRPLKRVGTEWIEISWQEAFSLCEQKLKQVQKQYGNDAVGLYVGNPTAHHPGALLMLPALIAALKTRSRFSASSVDQLAVMFASKDMFGSAGLTTVPDLERTDFMLMIGANPAASNGSLMSAGNAMGKITAISARGGRVVVIDPRRTETAIKADEHLFIRPGADVFLLAAMLQVLFVEKLTQPGHLSALVDGFERLHHAVEPFTPESVAAITGIEANTIRQLARDFASAPRAVCYGRIGANVQEFGGITAWLINALNVVTGNLDREGGAMFTQPAIDVVGMAEVAGVLKGVSERRTCVSGLPIFAGEMPVAALAEEIQTPGKGQIRALVTHAGNPVLSTPNGRQLDAAFEQLEFMVCVDIYLNETTRHADLILPPTSALERGHFDVLLNAWAVRNVVKYSSPMLPRPEGALHDWEILLELAVRLKSSNPFERIWWRNVQRIAESLKMEGMLDWLLRTGPYGHQPSTLPRLRRWLQRSPVSGKLYRRLEAVLLEATSKNRMGVLRQATALLNAKSRGLDLATVAAHPHGLDLGPLQSVLPDRLFTEDRRLKLAPEKFVADLERARTRLAERVDASTLLLIGRRHVRSNNSWMHNAHRLVKGKGRCTLMVHPDDAEALGITAGDQVRVSSRVGEIDLPAEVTADVMRGVVSVPHGFGHDRKGVKLSVAAQHAGVSVNDITDEKFVDALTGVAALNGMPVKVKALAAKKVISSGVKSTEETQVP